jgi:hypothetical protein
MARRRSDDDFDDVDRPRRRSRHDKDREDRQRRGHGRPGDDDDRPHRRRQSNKGLIIGLICGGAGLVVALVVVLVLVLSGGGAGSPGRSPAAGAQIIGKWTNSLHGTFDFQANGVLVVGGFAFDYTISGDIIDMSFPLFGGRDRERLKIEIQGDEMTWSPVLPEDVKAGFAKLRWKRVR